MEPSFEEAFDFDLNFIQQPFQNVMSNNKLRKAVLIAKKKTIATDALIKKYLAKKEIVQQTELLLNSAKEECKRVCIDYRDTLEKCSGLEKDNHTLDQKYLTLESNYTQTLNQYEAMKSHANQLQSLIRENELKIESLQLENKLLDKKNEKERSKNGETGYTSLKKENETLLNHILLFKDIIMGKKKLQKQHRLLLNKYKKTKQGKGEINDLHDDNYSSDDTDFLDDVTPPPSNETLQPPYLTQDIRTEPVFKENIDGKCTLKVHGVHESEHDSEDTGRGSSLAFSDCGKILNSPDYSCDVPDLETYSSNINTEKYLDASTNTSCNVEHKSTSPHMFDDGSPQNFGTDTPMTSEVVTITEKFKMVDCATSPVPEIVIIHPKPILSISNREDFRMDIPPSNEQVSINEELKMVDCASSPIPEVDVLNSSLSPSFSNLEDLMMDVSLTLNTEAVTTGGKLKMRDCATSPIQGVVTVHASSSPIIFLDSNLLNGNAKQQTEKQSTSISTIHDDTVSHDNTIQLKKIMNINYINTENIMLEKENNFDTHIANDLQHIMSSVDLSKNAVTEVHKKNLLEKCCLEENNSDIISRKCNEEIESIFSSMRLEHRLLTPIPHTPSKLRKSLNRKHHIVWQKQENCSDHKCCRNVISLKKKYLILQQHYVAMEKVINNMTSTLQELTVLPLKDIDDGLLNIDEYSDSEIGKDDLHRHALGDLEGVNQFDSMVPASISNGDPGNLLSQDIVVEGVMEVNDDDVPLSELIQQDITKSKPHRIINSDADLPAKSFNKNIEKNASSTHDIDRYNKIKIKKSKKLSKLEKLRHKMLPKYKITETIHKSVNKKKLIVTTRKNAETNKLCNNKLAYEKAVKIMTEVKKKNNDNFANNKTVRYNDTLKGLPNDDAAEENDNFSIISLVNTDDSTKETFVNSKTVPQLHQISNTVSNNEDVFSIMNRRTTRRQSKLIDTGQDTILKSTSDTDMHKMHKNISKIGNIKESKENVNYEKTVDSDETNEEGIKSNQVKENRTLLSSKNNINNSMCVSNQMSEDIEIGSNDVSNSVRQNKITTRSKSKRSESEGDTFLCHKYQQSTLMQNNLCKKQIEKPNIDNFNEEKERGNVITRNQSMLNFTNQVDIINQEKIKNYPDKRESILGSPRKSLNSRKRQRGICDEVCEPCPKRVLRSSKAKESLVDNINTSNKESSLIVSSDENSNISDKIKKGNCYTSTKDEMANSKNQEIIDYADLNMFTTTKSNNTERCDIKSTISYPKNSILCKSIGKYGKKSINFSTNKVTEQVSNSISTKLEEDIAQIAQMPADKICHGMKKLVEDVQKLPVKTFITGFIKYLRKPMRKQEMFKLVNTPPAPPMTKSEQILLFVIKQLKYEHSNIVECILENMEYCLFQLNKTPEFDIVESMSHFYAILCRYFGLKHRLRLFLLDAMYCLSFKAVTVVKQCFDVWMHVLPLAHMGIAKSPLVTCVVYLLHFYKCDDKFKKIDSIRYLLQYKYFYKITEMTEPKMLEMFKNAVKEINDVLIEKKILRTALIILAKRQGAAWCQKNIIKNILLPIIDEEKCSDISKQFAISMLGPLLKPYPMDMKVHCEIIVNQLMDMLDQNLSASDSMKEAIFTSLIFMSRQNHFRITQALLNWEPESVSQEFERVIKDFVRDKPIKIWTKILPKMLFQRG